MSTAIHNDIQISQQRGRWNRSTILTHTHTYSGLDHHGGPVRPPENYLNLQDWCMRRGIGAVGMGSPYTPKAAKTYGYYEHEALEEYYRPEFPFRQVMDDDEVRSMLTAAAADPGVTTLFYLDNETPKARYGHMWWVGYHYDAPPWHDYDQPFDRWMCETQIPGDFEPEPVPFERRPYTQIVSLQRSHGAVGCWAHPTSWWRDGAGRFITNIAVEAPAQMIADGYLDGFVVMGYHAFRPEYQAVWFALLDMGYRVPGVAEMDCGLSDPRVQGDQPLYLNAIPGGSDHAAQLTKEHVVAGFKSGDIVATTGIELEMSVDGKTHGQIVETSNHISHTVVVRVQPAPGQERIDRLQIIGRGGAILAEISDFAGGEVTFKIAGIDQVAYLVARAFGQGDLARPSKKQQHHAITSAVYLHPRGMGFTTKLNTMLTIQPQAEQGSRIQIQSPGGEVLSTIDRLNSAVKLEAPANGRVVISRPGSQDQVLYLINANPALQSVMRHLYRGRFLMDSPTTESGNVPVEHWQLPAYRQAMAEWTLKL